MTILQQLRGKPITMEDLAKRIHENGCKNIYSAKYIRNLNGYCKYREHMTIEIVKKLRCWHKLGCIFLKGNKQISICSYGFPEEPIYQNYRVILFPLSGV